MSTLMIKDGDQIELKINDKVYYFNCYHNQHEGDDVCPYEINQLREREGDGDENLLDAYSHISFVQAFIRMLRTLEKGQKDG